MVWLEGTRLGSSWLSTILVEPKAEVFEIECEAFPPGMGSFAGVVEMLCLARGMN